MLEVRSALPFLVSIIVINKGPESLQFSVSPGVTFHLKTLKEFVETLSELFPLVQMPALICGSSQRQNCTAGPFPGINDNW